MKKTFFILSCAITASAIIAQPSFAKSKKPASEPATQSATKAEKTPEQIDAQYTESLNKRADKIVDALNLTDNAAKSKVHDTLVDHWRSVKAYHDEHPDKLVTVEGMKAKIPDPADPDVKAIHAKLLAGLSSLSPEQVTVVKDELTIGKLAFTYKGYESIVPDMSDADKAFVRQQLTLAREEAVDARDTDAKSAVFKKYKKVIQQYFNDHGRNWDQMYKDYTNKLKAQKAAATQAAD